MEEEDIHPISGLTAQQRYENYKLLLDTDRFFKIKGNITPEWIEIHKQHILKYRTWYSDYSKIDENIIEPEFRKICKEIETLISYLVHQINTTNTFHIEFYRILNEHLKSMCQSQFGDEDLEDIMANMNLS